MLKYGNVLQISNGNSKTLIPRNLTNKGLNNSENKSTINGSNNQSTTNFNSASITDLTINSLNIIPNTLITNIVISSPVAFSVFKTDYETNNFQIYPILFTENIFINNKNFNLNTNNLVIKDNVFVLNNTLNNVTIEGNQTDNIISGFIFPIADNNQSTDYYSGFLYLPNNKLSQISPISDFYYWTNNQYNYFSNPNKGFYKFKYLPQSLNFNTFNNVMDKNYLDLVQNNKNLVNLQANGLALYDGEIVGLNNNLYFNLSDGTTLTNLINISLLKLNLLNNLGISFINNLFITDINNTNYISFDSTSVLLTFYQNILLNNTQQKISFIDTLDFDSGSNSYIKINAINNQIELLGTTLINSLQVLTLFELNNIPFQFINSLNIVSNNNTFIALDSIYNTIKMTQTTYIDNLIISNSFNISNKVPIIFTESMYINDNDGNQYLFFNSTNTQLDILASTFINILNINNSLNFINNSSVIFDTKFSIMNDNNTYLKVDIKNTSINNNLLLESNNPQINFPNGQTLNITNTNNSINLGIDTSITIDGPTYSYQDISNIIVASSFNITNTSATYSSYNFIPKSKIYILSGTTQINAVITFQFLEVINNNQMSGKIIGTTHSLSSEKINSYEINIWSYPINNQINIGYSSLSPVNTNNDGDWIIKNIYLELNNDATYILNIECNGSSEVDVVWAFKLDILQI